MYRALFYICLMALLTIFTGCIERYYPEEDDLKTGILVINAHLTDQPGEQVIEMSRSVGLTEPSFDPVSGSFAEVIREDGELQIFSEYKPGYYKAELNKSFLQTGMSFMIHLITPDGEEYESDFDKLRPVPSIDSIYYQVEQTSFSSESDSIVGIRFYIDFTYDDEAYDYIRWDVIETYEFHNPAMEAFVSIPGVGLIDLPDTSNYQVCYITNELHTIHSMSLAYLDFGIYVKKPFSFVPNIQQEQKLKHKYSLLIKQYSVGEAAFHYWNELKKTSQEQGWLFDQQPALLNSNFRNINDEHEDVLGFFCMSGVAEIRGFAVKPEGLDMSLYPWYCFPFPRGPGGPGGDENQAVYYARAWKDGESSFAWVNKHCVDCRAYENSTHIMPDFW